MDQLASVYYALYIGTNNASNPDNCWECYDRGPPAPSIGIQLPLFTNASEIALWGNISRHAELGSSVLKAKLIIPQLVHAQS